MVHRTSRANRNRAMAGPGRSGTRAPHVSEGLAGWRSPPRRPRENCAPADPRCHGFPYAVEDALRSMGSDGWCRVGWVAGRGGRDDWAVWVHVDTGEARHG